MTMEVSLLTYRLADFMKQISANQMEEIVNKERIHNERLMSQDQRSRMVSYNKTGFQYDAKKANGKNIVALKKRDKENQPCTEEEKIKQQKKLGTIWGASKNFKNIIDKDAESINKAKNFDKTVIAPTKNKFMKAAKIAVLISQVKQGRDICTCSSLDAKCYIHDS